MAVGRAGQHQFGRDADRCAIARLAEPLAAAGIRRRGAPDIVCRWRHRAHRLPALRAPWCSAVGEIADRHEDPAAARGECRNGCRRTCRRGRPAGSSAACRCRDRGQRRTAGFLAGQHDSPCRPRLLPGPVRRRNRGPARLLRAIAGFGPAAADIPGVAARCLVGPVDLAGRNVDRDDRIAHVGGGRGIIVAGRDIDWPRAASTIGVDQMATPDGP